MTEKSASTNDHSVPIATPISRHDQCLSKQYKTVQFRPLHQEGVDRFGDWLQTEDWDCINDGLNPTEQVKIMEAKLGDKLDKLLPQKTLKVSSHEKPWISYDLKKIARLKRREYIKHGRSEKYKKLQSKFDTKFEDAAKRYLDKNVTEMENTNPGKAYKILKRMGAPPGECEDEGYFTLKNHSEDNLSTEESIEKIANFFAQISQEYSPLNIESLPHRVKVKLNSMNSDQNTTPSLSEREVWEQIIKSKKTNSMVPGDIPKPIVQKYPEELAVPVSKVYNQILNTKHWPSMWRTEYGVPYRRSLNLNLKMSTELLAKHYD